MATKIFLTGVTGYIGGDAFYSIEKAHPDFEYTLLVRSEEKAKLVKEKYPNVKFVFGDLNSSDVIANAAAAADIVVHTAESADDIPSAKAIAKGLAAGHTAEKPGYWIHICGTGILTWYDEKAKRYGQPPVPEERYDDIANLDRILNLPDEANHRDVDKIILEAATANPAVKPAIVGPPTIYGPGRGPVNQRSVQVYELARYGLSKGYVPYVNTGKTEWDNVHVHDLGDLFVLLVDAALDPKKRVDPELFGPKTYFFAENGVHVWGEVSQWVADEAHRQGFLKEATVKQIDMEEVKAQSGNPTWGLNSKSTATRPRKYLGWSPKGKSLKDEIPDVVAGEAKRLGLKSSK